MTTVNSFLPSGDVSRGPPPQRPPMHPQGGPAMPPRGPPPGIGLPPHSHMGPNRAPPPSLDQRGPPPGPRPGYPMQGKSQAQHPQS